MKRTAVPSQHLPQETITLPSVSNRTERKIKRAEMKEILNTTASDLTLQEKCSLEEREHSADDIEAAESLIQLLGSQPHYSGPKTFCDFQVQVNMPRVQTICDLLATDSALNSFTGLNSFELLDTLLEAVQSVYIDQRSHKLSVKERIVLVLVKLKCDLSYVTLAILFGISHELCKKYVLEMLPILSRVLQSTIRFPSVSEIRKNMPLCFRQFDNVRIVLDCTEMVIQKPKCLCCRIRFYSQYKSNTTVKIMTGVSPGGIITFVSEPFGGRASDKVIFQKSNLISKLEYAKDAIMVDKGFLVQDICDQYKIQVIQPPFLKKQKQLSMNDALLNSKIAAARVHIERVYQRIKIFKILSGKMQWSLVPYVKDIFIIACGITNLSSPILADNKFLCDV